MSDDHPRIGPGVMLKPVVHKLNFRTLPAMAITLAVFTDIGLGKRIVEPREATAEAASQAE